MKTITFKTTLDIDFDQWIAQAKRFASIQDQVIQNNLAIDTSDSKHASIDVRYDKPLSTGFHGHITYWQHYEKQIEQLIDPIDPDSGTELITIVAKHKVIDYRQFIPSNTIESMIDQALLQLPNNINGYFNRELAAITAIINYDIVSKSTFGLSGDKWEAL